MRYLVLIFLLSISKVFFGQTVLTNNNHVTVINKTMDWNNNTFLNFPFGTGTVGSVATTDGFGITSSVANPTTTPNITIAIDSASATLKNFIAQYSAGGGLQDAFDADNLLTRIDTILTGNNTFSIMSNDDIFTNDGARFDLQDESLIHGFNIETYKAKTGSDYAYAWHYALIEGKIPLPYSSPDDTVSYDMGAEEKRSGDRWNAQVTLMPSVSRLTTQTPYTLTGNPFGTGIGIDSMGQLRIDTTLYSLEVSETMLTWDSVSKTVLHRQMPDFSGFVTSVSGTSNRITSSGGTTPVIDISASYVGQASITTLGTITTGVWNGTAIANANLQNSTISGVALGGNLFDLTIGTNLQLSSGTTYNGSAARTVSLQNAAADGSTRGAASFTANDFDASSGNISIDYTNGQAASGSNKGFLTSADWTTFNSKQDALVSGTNIKSLDGSSILGSGNRITDYTLNAYSALGSVTLAQTVGANIGNMSTSSALADGTARFFAVWLPQAATITGVKWIQVVQGNYTSDNYNGVALYTYDGAGNLNQVAISTDDGNIWKGASNSMQSKAFSSTYAASAGILFVALLYNSSAQVAAPTLGLGYNFAGTSVPGLDFTNSAKISGLRASQTAFANPQTMSTLTGTAAPWVALY